MPSGRARHHVADPLPGTGAPAAATAGTRWPGRRRHRHFRRQRPDCARSDPGLHDAGRRVPEDVSVVGFDDTPESGYFLPPLTTVRQDSARSAAAVSNSCSHSPTALLRIRTSSFRLSSSYPPTLHRLSEQRVETPSALGGPGVGGTGLHHRSGRPEGQDRSWDRADRRESRTGRPD